MANEGNLKPFGKGCRTVKEEREIQSKGGISSGVARSFKAAAKAKLKERPELTSEILDVISDLALQGNLQAVRLFLELNGETVQQEELALKKKLMRNQSKADNGKLAALLEGLQGDDLHEEAASADGAVEDETA